ncbi:MAG: ferredoxin reductase family protein [Desulfomonilaceae bacterium]|nr:ferredoxin reductase family protein [Desulfomonilaceae bacterium]
MGVLLVVVYGLLILSPLITVAALWMKGEMTLMHETGTSAAFAAYGIIALQPVLTARWKFVERPFGLDVISRFHRYMGLFAAALLLSHPPLMAYGGAGVKLLLTLEQPWYVLLGKAVLVLLLINVCVSMWYARFGLGFEQWRRFHNVLAMIVIPCAFVHSWWSGYDMGPKPMVLLWFGLLGLTVWAYVDRKLVQPMRLERRPYRVSDVEQETHNVWTVKLAPPEGERIYDHHPGQFHFVTLYRSEGVPVEEHHWTISSSPTQREHISSTIKESGDFTSTIGRTAPGDTAIVQGPFGRFSYTLYPQDKEYVFIAGGIGITPFMSMLRHMRDTGNDAEVLLIYANSTEQDIVFRSEIEEMEHGTRPRLSVIHVVGKPDEGWTGQSGRLTPEALVRLVGPDSEDRAYYVCVPPGMAKVVIRGLRSMGVPYRRMRREEFSL